MYSYRIAEYTMSLYKCVKRAKGSVDVEESVIEGGEVREEWSDAGPCSLLSPNSVSGQEGRDAKITTLSAASGLFVARDPRNDKTSKMYLFNGKNRSSSYFVRNKVHN